MSMNDEDAIKARINIIGQLEGALLRSEGFISHTISIRSKFGIPPNGYDSKFQNEKFNENDTKSEWDLSISELLALGHKPEGWRRAFEQFVLTGKLHGPLERAKVVHKTTHTKVGSYETTYIEIIDDLISADAVREAIAADNKLRIETKTKLKSKVSQRRAYDHEADRMLIKLKKKGLPDKVILEEINRVRRQPIADIWELQQHLRDAKKRIDRDKI